MMRQAAWMACAALAASMLAGCSNQPVQAPVLERAPVSATRPAPAPAATRSDRYTVKRGDTMFSIALDHGLDYKELAAWNNIDNPSRIRPGQQLRITPPAGAQEAPVIVNPITSAGRVESRPLAVPGAPPGAAAAAAAPPKAEAQTAPAAALGSIKSEPQARKLPYTPENLALLQRADAPPAAAAPSPAPVPAPAVAAAVPSAPVAAPAPAQAAAAEDDEDKVDWGWPVQGKIIAGFSEASNKGLDIAAKLGDPVIAAAPGRVVYSGSGLRGYGKLVIVKHNKTYLSAYAHNSVILVKEGQSVVKGQKIAEVGNTDSDKPMLHFEIRKLGKPVDPAKYLPPS